MPSLRDFITALQAGWFPALAALVGCSLIIAGDYLRVPYLDKTPAIVLTLAVTVGVFSFSILVANIAYLPVVVWKIIRQRKANKVFIGKLLQEVDAAPNEEKIILAYLVTSGRKAFVAEFNDKRLAPLVSKGLIIRLGGTHNVLEWPYMVREDVWDYLVKHREAFRIKLPEDGLDPFDWRSRGW